MTDARDIRLGRYGIGKYRYRELKYFCRQYREKKTQLDAITEISASQASSVPSGTKMGDRTSQIALKRVSLQKDIEDIEQSAKEADCAIYAYLIGNVADGIPYEHLGVPCGRRYFYEARKKFFYLLSLRRK